MKFAEAWNEGVAVFGLYCFFLGIIALFGFYAYQRIKKQTGNKFVAGIVVATFAALAHTAYPTSAEKNPDRKDPIGFLRTDPEIVYLIDTGSWVSNNVVHLEYSTRLLPPSAPLFLDYIPKTESPDSNNYSTYLSGTVESVPNVVEFEFEGAISNRWVFYTTYTPGPVVHTNGVAIAEFLRVPGKDNAAVPKRSTIWEGSECVWPKTNLLERVNLLEELGGNE